jgi:hypothetical protein
VRFGIARETDKKNPWQSRALAYVRESGSDAGRAITEPQP